MIDLIKVRVGPTVGVAGSALASAVSQHISGLIQAIYVQFEGAHPATTDIGVVVTNATTAANAKVLVIANVNTSAKYYPRNQEATNANSLLLYNATQTKRTCYPVHESVTCTIAQSNPDLYITFWIWIERTKDTPAMAFSESVR